MDLHSILIITYLASGTPVQSEVPMIHGQCMAAEKALSAAILGPQAIRPKVEMMSGKFAPMIAAECLPACIPDALGPEPLELIAKGEDA